jgi:DNA repair exonuclease SbcCD nuclease subunit
MNIVTTADWHLRNNDSYGVYDSHGVNDFLRERIRICEIIINEALELNAHLINVGDMIDDTIVDSITLYYSSMLVKKMKELILALLLEGNHGFDGKDNKHSVIAHWKHLAGKNVHIVTYPKIVRANNISYHCVPAVNDVDKLLPSILKDLWNSKKKSDLHILVFHGPIISARFDSGIKAKTGVKFDIIRKAAKRYDYIVCGDFHRYQKLLPNVWYTGSPFQTSLKDKGQQKGYQVISNNSVKFERLDSYRFIDVEWIFDKSISPVLKKPEMYQASLRNTIVIIRLYYSIADNYNERLTYIKKQLYRNGVYRIFVDKKVKEQKKKRTTISANMSFQQMIEAYVSHQRNSLPARKHKVVEVGLQYLR